MPGETRRLRSSRQAFTVLALVLFGVEPALAQEPERRGFIGLGIGPSAPLGNFAEASSTNPRGGRATVGYTDTFLNIGYRFRQRLGVAAAFSYSEYPMRGGSGDDDWWQVATLTVGPMYSLRLNARAAVDVKAMVGLTAVTPVVEGYSTVDGVGSGVGLDVRVAVRYDVFRRWALFAEGGLQLAGISFTSGVQQDYAALISGFGVAYRPAW